ncbi:NAD(+) diphosphatase [Agromyces aerolatus]|uniref:NAD(+) diphosphatase n=1 Tax=Agromyces sp. LY-1074 TaxID=3074080 RepID=UPI0028555474|nr:MULTISPECIES: NAD(+) diphosphatase [unclassified Agromyces]MDR5698938.1 NAD(+) diphosphatase [Agromyces sp. LY-1074]MDR5705284.1 NAD(+) diphosphatase [Agromyces sp. LY-1358]
MHAVPPLARAAIDRDGLARADETFGARFDADPSSRVVMVHGDRLLIGGKVDGSPPALDLRHPSALPEPTLRCYLGRTLTTVPGSDASAGAPVELRVFDEASAARIEPEAARWAGLRDLAPVLDDRDASLATEAVALANWHATHPRCPRCGAETEPVQAGWARRCVADESLHFPRTDPAVIVLVTDDADRVLLGSNALWEQRRFSLLAGFVEPGESLEAAVVREIGEEAGVAVDRVEYAASQPWPFPASIMLGFTARVAAGVNPSAAVPDGEEILQLRWLSREELVAAKDEVVLPGSSSIARWLLERWFGGPLEAHTAPWSGR